MRLAIALLILCGACDRKGGDNPFKRPTKTGESETGSATAEVAATGSAATGSATATATAAGVAATPPATVTPPATGKVLPRAIDVLPADHVGDKEALLVVGDNWRFQIPKNFTAIDHPSKAAYKGTIAGFASDAPVTIWATTETFTGDLAALAESERNSVKANGGTKTVDGPVLIDVAGKIANTHAHRIVAKLPDRYDMRILVVHGGRAYIYHCETPNVPNAWINVGSDCMVRGTTFNVAPPASAGGTASAATTTKPPPTVTAPTTSKPPATTETTATTTTTKPPPTTTTPTTGGLKVGDRVNAKWTNGSWYPGKIVAVQANGTYDVTFDDGDKARGLDVANVRAISLPAPLKNDWEVGDRMQGLWTDGRWYGGKIEAINEDGTFKVVFDDGDVSDALPATKIRAPSAKGGG